MGGDGARFGQFRLDFFGQLLTEFHAHLVVGIDVPDRTLDEDLVLIEGDEGTKGLGIKSLDQNGVGWPVAGKHLMRKQFF